MNNAIIGFIVGSALAWAGATIYVEQTAKPEPLPSCPSPASLRSAYEAGMSDATSGVAWGWEK